MATRWVIRLTILTLTLSFALIGVGIYLVVTQGRDLTEARREVALRGSGVLYLDQSLSQTTRFLADLKDLVKTVCQLPAGGVNTRRLCETLVGNAELIRSLNSAALSRASSVSSDDFRETERHYREALRLADRAAGPERPRWIAYAHEGIAYSRYRQGNLDAAAAAIRQARQADPAFQVAALTELKIRCAQGEDSQALSGALERWRAQLGSGSDEALRHDQELELVCRI